MNSLEWEKLAKNIPCRKFSLRTSKMPVYAYQVMPFVFIHVYEDGSRAVIETRKLLEKLNDDHLYPNLKETNMNFIPSFVCKKTDLPVAFSELPYYTFYSEELDEDLFTIEVDLKVSDEAKEEAKYLLENGIPTNFSNDESLETFVRYSVLFDKFDNEVFKTLTVLHDELEYDTAVLVAMLYYKFF